MLSGRGNDEHLCTSAGGHRLEDTATRRLVRLMFPRSALYACVAVTKRKDCLRCRNRRLRCRNRRLRCRNRRLRCRNRCLRCRNRRLRCRNRRLRCRNRRLRCRNRRLRCRNRRLRCRNRCLRCRNRCLRCRNRRLRCRNQRLRCRNRRLRCRNRRLRCRNQSLRYCKGWLRYHQKWLRYNQECLRCRNPRFRYRKENTSRGQRGSMSRTDVAQTLLSVPDLGTTQDRKPLAAGGFGAGTDKSVCATSVPGLRRQARLELGSREVVTSLGVTVRKAAPRITTRI